MDAFIAIKKRRSLRVYQDRAIAKKDLEEIIDAARLAPTARNEQPWEFVVVTEKEKIKKLANITDHGKFMAAAYGCIAVFCQNTKYYLEDGSAATENILLAATALGIGSCWIAGDKKEYAAQISHALGVPENYKLISLIALGYPKEEAQTPQKRALKEVLHWEKF
jgi:nitroreductase